MMRFQDIKHGKIRIIRRFLLFPMKINNITKWLEFADIKQEYDIGGPRTIDCYDSPRWKNKNFLN